MTTEYEHRSEILTHGLRRDVWLSIANTLEHSGQIGLAKDIKDFLTSREEDR
jgi:hypothetical protein